MDPSGIHGHRLKNHWFRYCIRVVANEGYGACSCLQFVPQQARRQVLSFGGQNTFLRGKGFCFNHMFKTNFSGDKKFGGQKI